MKASGEKSLDDFSNHCRQDQSLNSHECSVEKVNEEDGVTEMSGKCRIKLEDKSLLQCLDAARFHSISQLNSANMFVNSPENYHDKLWLKCGITGESSKYATCDIAETSEYSSEFEVTFKIPFIVGQKPSAPLKGFISCEHFSGGKFFGVKVKPTPTIFVEECFSISPPVNSAPLGAILSVFRRKQFNNNNNFKQMGSQGGNISQKVRIGVIPTTFHFNTSDIFPSGGALNILK